MYCYIIYNNLFITLVVTNKNDYYSDLDNLVIGIDEVGRGALCGPVVSCALILNENIRQENYLKKLQTQKVIWKKE